MIITLGDLVADVVAAVLQLPIEPEVYQEAHYVRLEPGGAGNFLITGARLGLPVAPLGMLGDDSFGHDVYRTLSAEGIDMTLIEQPEGTTTTIVLVLSDDHGSTIMTGASGSGPELPWRPRWDTALAQAEAIFTFGYSLRQHRIRSIALECMRRGRARGIPVMFDPGPQFRHLEAKHRAEVLNAADIILLTQSEVAALSPDGPEQLLEHSIAVVVKSGPGGCRIYTRDGTVDVPGFPVVAIETAGAGDCFAAGFVYEYLRSHDLERAAVVANAAGAAKVQKRGTGRQSPNAAEVRAVLAQFRSALSL